MWELGRQGTGYEKLKIFSFWRVDCYLLRLPEGSYIPKHVDKIDSGKHYRLNIILKDAKVGGVFICDNPIYETKRVKLFRSDLSEHSVAMVIKGTRYVLSIGWSK